MQLALPLGQVQNLDQSISSCVACVPCRRMLSHVSTLWCAIGLSAPFGGSLDGPFSVGSMRSRDIEPSSLETGIGRSYCRTYFDKYLRGAYLPFAVETRAHDGVATVPAGEREVSPPTTNLLGVLGPRGQGRSEDGLDGRCVVRD
eukprot:6192778-Pleurochrysis_carterae.AAC.1